ncbi:hypothetical protein H312_01040 [Anncaliia algerae PRA339]|uniref:CS domain-containing protein n=1 Tax=Anncaliia algerae PRA339 TaxID=1288291 RepID=A0A059F338_9MICR|nr:hypothetical protein H312_01040 [Anncaliia algerae PRA339]
MIKLEWKQEFNELEFTITFEENFNQKYLQHEINNNTFKLIYRGIVFLNEAFSLSVKKETLYWEIKNNSIIYNIEKKKAEWWDSLFINGEKVDKEKLASEKIVDLSLLGAEERKILSEMIYKQSNK